MGEANYILGERALWLTGVRIGLHRVGSVWLPTHDPKYGICLFHFIFHCEIHDPLLWGCWRRHIHYILFNYFLLIKGVGITYPKFRIPSVSSDGPISWAREFLVPMAVSPIVIICNTLGFWKRSLIFSMNKIIKKQGAGGVLLKKGRLYFIIPPIQGDYRFPHCTL